MFQRIMTCAILVIALTSIASAGLVVNEVLSNEPGGDVGLEWVEIYNDSTDAVLTGFYYLSIGADSVSLAPLGNIAAKSYAVIA